MKYQHLTLDQQDQMLVNRIQQLEAEHFQHSLNAEALDIATDISEGEKQRSLENTQAAMTTIEAAHKIACDKLSELRGDNKKK